MKNRFSSISAIVLCAVLALCLGAALPARGSSPDPMAQAVREFLDNQRLFLERLVWGSLQTVRPTRKIPVSLVDRTMEELLSDSTLIAEGTITGDPETIQIEHATVPGMVRPYTCWNFTITHVLKGEPYAGTVSVRLPGGKNTEGVTEIYSGTPEFQEGDEYLLFLFNPKCGNAFNTEGDYYSLYGLVQGASYKKTGDGTYVNPATENELPAYALVSAHLDEPVDEDLFRRRDEEAFRHNYETGMDT